MNRRELLKSLPLVAVTPAFYAANEKSEVISAALPLEEGPFYLFVVNPASADVQSLAESFQGSKVRGAFVVAQDCDVENYCRIYKLEE